MVCFMNKYQRLVGAPLHLQVFGGAVVTVLAKADILLVGDVMQRTTEELQGLRGMGGRNWGLFYDWQMGKNSPWETPVVEYLTDEPEYKTKALPPHIARLRGVQYERIQIGWKKGHLVQGVFPIRLGILLDDIQAGLTDWFHTNRDQLLAKAFQQFRT